MNHFETRLKAGDNTFKELFRRYPYNPILMAKDWPYPVNVVLNPAATMFRGRCCCSPAWRTGAASRT